MITPDAIEEFCHQCYTLKALYNQYIFLYESDRKSRSDLLNKTARDFFNNLQDILIERIFLDICKITDPATSGKNSNLNSNLTIKYILKEIEQDTKKNLGLDELSNEIHKFREHVVEARNKIIAHSDFETIKSNKTLGTFTKSENDKFWENLLKFVNKISNHYFKSPVIIDNIVDGTFNAKDLILALKKAAYFDQHFENVPYYELLEGETFKYRDA